MASPETLSRPGSEINTPFDTSPEGTRTMSSPLCLSIDTHSNNLNCSRCTTNDINQKHGSGTGDSYNAYLQTLVEHLRCANTTQGETITELKIQVAVLESELRRASQDKDAANHSLRIVIESLSQSRSSYNSNNHISASGIADPQRRDGVAAATFEKVGGVVGVKVEQSQKAHTFISKNLKETEKLRSLVNGGDIHGAGQGRQPDLNNSCTLHMNGTKSTSRFDGRDSISASNPPLPNPPTIEQQDSTSKGPDDHVSRPKEGPNINSTTIVNSSPNAKIPDGISEWPEFRTLEDLLAEDTDDEEALEEKRQRDKYYNFPTPGVIKTGIEAIGIYMGNDTELVPSEKPVTGRWFKGHDRYRSAPRTPWENRTPPNDPILDPMIWNSAEERKSAIQAHQSSIGSRQGRYCPGLFQYGAQFRPAETESGHLRGVLISNLPQDIELRDVLSKVRGGEIHSSVLCNTMPLTGGMSAFITFKYATPGASYVSFAATNPITFSTASQKTPQTAIITQIQTPSYPYRPASPAQTRCIKIHDFYPAGSVMYLQEQLGLENSFRAKSLLEVWIDKESSLYLQFSSIPAAGVAYGCLKYWSEYSSMRIHFVEDPCGGAVEELLEEVKPRPPLFPEASAETSDSEFEEVVTDQIQSPQSRQSPGLLDENIHVPKFNGAGIRGMSWADEVIEEHDIRTDLAVIGRSPTSCCNATSGGESNKDVQLADKSPFPNTNGDNIDAETLVQKESSSTLSTLMLGDLNRLMGDKNHKIWESHKRPAGIAGSRYASTAAPLIKGHEPGMADGAKVNEEKVDRFVVNRNSEATDHHRGYRTEERLPFRLRAEQNDEVSSAPKGISAESSSSSSSPPISESMGASAGAELLRETLTTAETDERKKNPDEIELGSDSEGERMEESVRLELSTTAEKVERKNPGEIELGSDSEGEGEGEGDIANA